MSRLKSTGGFREGNNMDLEELRGIGEGSLWNVEPVMIGWTEKLQE